VRGYRENAILRDNGVFGSVEVRVPVIYVKNHVPMLFVAPFFDIGSGWNTLSDASPASKGKGTTGVGLLNDRQMETLPSAGIGLIFNHGKYVHAELYWGYGFNRQLVSNNNNLQDYGIHFAVSVNAF
jgi:hemolysin activation/secretion protein